MRSDTILVTCPHCGDQRVACHDMSLVVSDGVQHAYSFRCRECGEIVIRLCDEGVAARLSAIGVCVTATAEPDRAPFTLRDVVIFERTLRAEDFVVRLITGV